MRRICPRRRGPGGGKIPAPGDSMQGAEQGKEQQGEKDQGDPPQVAVEGAADGELVAADGAAVLVGGNLHAAAGALAHGELAMGINAHVLRIPPDRGAAQDL